jgi:hypothetical protein
MSDHIVDTVLFQAVFQMVEKENEDSYLFSRLKKKAEIVAVGINSFLLKFQGDIEILITNDLDVYYLKTFADKVYCNGEDGNTKLSGDRVSFYLNRILDLVIYGR